MSISKYSEIMLPTLWALMYEKPHSSQEIMDFLIDQFNFTDKELNEVQPSGSTIVNNRASIARQTLVKMGAINKLKGKLYQITSKGVKIVECRPLGVTQKYLDEIESVFAENHQDLINKYPDITYKFQFDAARKDLILKELKTDWKIHDVVLPDCITMIDSDAIKSPSIKSIVIPASVRSIRKHAFCSCASLSSITFKGDLS